MVEPVQDLMGFIDASPTQFHAAHNAAARLVDAGFEEFVPELATRPGARFVLRDAALVAWVDSEDDVGPGRMIGAHTDSPNLRLRPRPDLDAAGLRQLGVEVYGGALLNSWLDRDLGLAGRVACRDGDGMRHVLFRSSEALLRVPQLAIHLDRDISDKGLLLDRQRHMTPVWGIGQSSEGDFREWIADQLGVADRDVLGWDLACFDHQGSARLGVDAELLAAPRLDNLCSTFGALEALIAMRWASDGPGLIILYDHEEVGSTSTSGAASTWVASVLEQRAFALGTDRSTHLEALAGSMLLSADMAHATHPNYTDRHEPSHWVAMGSGPTIKHNVSQRYATDSGTAAAFRLACESAGVPVQDYSHRGDLPCGSTIGPTAAAQLAVPTVDVGVPQLSMHSARELMAVADVDLMVRAFAAWLAGDA